LLSSRAGQGRAGQGRAGQGRAGHPYPLRTGCHPFRLIPNKY